MSDEVAGSSLPVGQDGGQKPSAANEADESQLPSSSPKPVVPPLRCEEISTMPDAAENGDEPSSPKADSEAETIIQSDRESLSPEKMRKYIKHGPQPDDDSNCDAGDDKEKMIVADDIRGQKRKATDDEVQSRTGNRMRSLSPRPRQISPSSPGLKAGQVNEPHLLPRIQDFPQEDVVESQSEAVGTSRKRSFSESVEGEGEPVHRMRKHHSPVAPRDRDAKDSPNIPLGPSESHDRAVSPFQKRNISGSQCAASDVQRRKKLSAISSGQRHSSEDRQSVSSSARSSPLPSAHRRKLTPTDASAVSPVRLMPPKKQRDQNGRTRLARACAAQELDAAITRLTERPEDLNVADNAGNTPLQIAALEGCAPIVKFLLNAGCEVETRNIDKDTPLIDAVENGHLEVVKLLLNAGANPRSVNAEGDEPYELVPSDCEDYDEIRRVITQAKAEHRHRRQSNDLPAPGRKELPSQLASSQKLSAPNPRESPPVSGPVSPPAFGALPRRKTVRSEITRNDLLWTKATPETLREFAAKGDMAGVATILNVLQKADTESVIAAAKGGHDEVLSLLFGMGDADPDPNPLNNGIQKPGHNTPMLAAIGRGNIAVIKLLLSQPRFNPTRRLYKDLTYYELSRDRGGGNEEYKLLREAYDDYSQAKKSRKLSTSSPRRLRDMDRGNQKNGEGVSPVSRPRKLARSPSLVRSHESTNTHDSWDRKREGADPSKVFGRLKPSLSARRGSESSVASRPEELRKRRRLIAGRPPHDRNQRRPSLLSSDSLSGREDGRRPRLDTVDFAGPKPVTQSLKRFRNSLSPERSRSCGSESEHSRRDVKIKKRRVVSEDTTTNVSNDVKKFPEHLKSHPLKVDDGVLDPSKNDVPQTEVTFEQKSIMCLEPIGVPIKEELEKQETTVLSDMYREDVGNVRSDAKKPEDENESLMLLQAKITIEERLAEEERIEKMAADAKQARRAKEMAKQAAYQAREKALEELGTVQSEAKKLGNESGSPTSLQSKMALEDLLVEEKRTEERLAEEKRIATEARRARRAKEEAEQAARQAREKAEEEERKRKEAEQRRIKQAEEEHQKRLEQERLRLAKLRREQEELEQRRRDALPSRLRAAAMLVGSNDPKARSHAWLKKFMPVVTAVTKQLDPFCAPESADEKWVPNYLVAPLLATNDLQLSQYASWEKRKATPTQRMNLWRVTRRMLMLVDDSEFHQSSVGEIMRQDRKTRPKYFDMEHVFWVKLSDFMDLVPHIPHLNGLEIQFLRMHIDCEPSAHRSFADLPQHDGLSYEPSHISGPNGLHNGSKSLSNGHHHHHHHHHQPSKYL